MSDADIVEMYNEILDAQWRLLHQWDKTAVEEPPGEKQIDYHENSDQWVSRVGVALVGVAVATALVPPLATAGILLTFCWGAPCFSPRPTSSPSSLPFRQFFG